MHLDWTTKAAVEPLVHVCPSWCRCASEAVQYIPCILMNIRWLTSLKSVVRVSVVIPQIASGYRIHSYPRYIPNKNPNRLYLASPKIGRGILWFLLDPAENSNRMYEFWPSPFVSSDHSNLAEEGIFYEWTREAAMFRTNCIWISADGLVNRMNIATARSDKGNSRLLNSQQHAMPKRTQSDRTAQRNPQTIRIFSLLLLAALTVFAEKIGSTEFLIADKHRNAQTWQSWWRFIVAHLEFWSICMCLCVCLIGIRHISLLFFLSYGCRCCCFKKVGH